MADSAVDIKSLFTALSRKKEKEEIGSWRTLAKELGISSSTFTRLEQGGRPDVDTFAKLVGWLGVEADHFIRASSKKPINNEENVTVMVSTYLRAAKNLEPAQANALDEMFQAAYQFVIKNKKP